MPPPHGRHATGHRCCASPRCDKKGTRSDRRCSSAKFRFFSWRPTGMAAKIGLIAGACVALTAAGAATAHHSFGMFDQKKEVTLEATVVEYRWKNPHTHLVVSVPDGAQDPATVGTWDI